MEISAMRADICLRCQCGQYCLTNLRETLGDSIIEVYNLRESRFKGTLHIHNTINRYQ